MYAGAQLAFSFNPSMGDGPDDIKCASLYLSSQTYPELGLLGDPSSFPVGSE